MEPQANEVKYWSDDRVRWFWRTVAEKVVAEHRTLGPIAEQISRQIEPGCEPWQVLGEIIDWRNKQVASLPNLEHRSSYQQIMREIQEQARRKAEEDEKQREAAKRQARRQEIVGMLQELMKVSLISLGKLGLFLACTFLVFGPMRLNLRSALRSE